MHNPAPRRGYVWRSGGTNLYLYFGAKWRCVFSSTPEGMWTTLLWTEDREGPRGEEKKYLTPLESNSDCPVLLLVLTLMFDRVTLQDK